MILYNNIMKISKNRWIGYMLKVAFLLASCISHYLNMVVFVCFIALCPHVVNSYGHIWTVSYPNHTFPRQACLGQITST